MLFQNGGKSNQFHLSNQIITIKIRRLEGNNKTEMLPLEQKLAELFSKRRSNIILLNVNESISSDQFKSISREVVVVSSFLKFLNYVW